MTPLTSPVCYLAGYERIDALEQEFSLEEEV